MTKRLVVRTTNNMIWEVDRETLEAMHCQHFDPWCWAEPEADAEYITPAQWMDMQIARMSQAEQRSWGRTHQCA